MLIKAKASLFQSYYEACLESYDNNIREWMPFDPKDFKTWKNQILKVYKDYEEGYHIPKNMPRTYSYWFEDSGEFIGEVQIRPYINKEEAEKWGHIAYAVRYSKWRQGYGTKLLGLAIEKAKDFDLKELYIVCNSNNIGSIKVIEKNNGQYLKQVVFNNIENNIYTIKL